MLNAINSEFQKLKSLKSTLIVSLSAIFLMVLFAFGYAFFVNDPTAIGMGSAQYPIWKYSSAGISLAQIAISVIAILTVTNEYNFGTIATSLLATPNRVKLYSAKMIVIALFSTIVVYLGQIISFITVFAIAPNYRLGKNFFDAFSIQASVALGSHIFSTVALALIAATLGFLFRNAAGAIVTYVLSTTLFSSLALSIALMAKSDFIIRLVELLPDRLVNDISKFSPIGNVASDESGLLSGTQYSLSFWPAIAGLSIWIIALVAVSLFFFKKRDA